MDEKNYNSVYEADPNDEWTVNKPRALVLSHFLGTVGINEKKTQTGTKVAPRSTGTMEPYFPFQKVTLNGQFSRVLFQWVTRTSSDSPLRLINSTVSVAKEVCPDVSKGVQSGLGIIFYRFQWCHTFSGRIGWPSLGARRPLRRISGPLPEGSSVPRRPFVRTVTPKTISILWIESPSDQIPLGLPKDVNYPLEVWEVSVTQYTLP